MDKIISKIYPWVLLVASWLIMFQLGGYYRTTTLADHLEDCLSKGKTGRLSAVCKLPNNDKLLRIEESDRGFVYVIWKRK